MQADWFCQGKGSSEYIIPSFHFCLILNISLSTILLVTFLCFIRRKSSVETESDNKSPMHQTHLFTNQNKYFILGEPTLGE